VQARPWPGKQAMRARRRARRTSGTSGRCACLTLAWRAKRGCARDTESLVRRRGGTPAGAPNSWSTDWRILAPERRSHLVVEAGWLEELQDAAECWALRVPRSGMRGGPRERGACGWARAPGHGLGWRNRAFGRRLWRADGAPGACRGGCSTRRGIARKLRRTGRAPGLGRVDARSSSGKQGARLVACCSVRACGDAARLQDGRSPSPWPERRHGWRPRTERTQRDAVGRSPWSSLGRTRGQARMLGRCQRHAAGAATRCCGRGG
jgi:hypothetical protein